MKKILYVATLVLGIGPCALVLAQPDAARTNATVRGPEHATVRGPEHGAAQPKTAAQLRRVLVNCRDGTRHIARVCRRHGGIARDQSVAQ